jgi:hypothetical protein
MCIVPNQKKTQGPLGPACLRQEVTAFPATSNCIAATCSAGKISPAHDITAQRVRTPDRAKRIAGSAAMFLGKNSARKAA